MQISKTNQALFRRIILRLIIIILTLVLIFYGLPLFFQLLYPFIFSYFLAALVNPLINLLGRKISVSRMNIRSSVIKNILTFIFTILILLTLFIVSYFVFSTLLNEVFDLANGIQDNWTTIVEMFENTEQWLTEQLDILPIEAIEIVEGITDNILNFLRNLSRNLLNYTVSFTGSVISKAGTFSINLITFFLSLYFMMSNFERINNFIRRITNKQIVKNVNLVKETVVVGLGGYVKTQLILALVVFVVMLFAFTIYGQEYALIIAIFLAVIDLIPLIGTIAVLLPWGIVEFIINDPNFGVFLILIGIGLFLLRRMIEPKIMGSQTGMHPLLALISIYVGIQFSGLWGALLGPLIMIVLLGVIRSGILDNTIADLSQFYHLITATLKRPSHKRDDTINY